MIPERGRKQLIGIGVLVCLGLVAIGLCLYWTFSIAAAEQHWASRGPQHYRLGLTFASGPWYAGRYDVIVRDGQIVQKEVTRLYCRMTNNGCDLIKLGDLSIPGLFMHARTALEEPECAWDAVMFDWYYGFPHRVTIDKPRVFDDDMTWTVESFEVLP